MYRLKVDGRTCNAGPILWKYDRIYVQLRAFADCLGGQVDWLPQPYGVASVVFNGFGKTPVTLDFKPLIESPTMSMQEYADQHPIRFNMGAYAPFIWSDDHTYLPFRYLTDAADYKTVFTAGTGGEPHEVNVYRQDHAVPEDGYVVNPSHVIVNKDWINPFQLASEPTGGWPFMPATLRMLQSEMLQANWAIQDMQQDPQTRIDMTMNTEKVLIDVRAHNTINPSHVTFYGPHFIRWFDDFGQVEDFKKDLKIAAHVGDGLKTAGGTIGTGGAAWLLGAPVAPFAVAAAGLSVGWWIYDAGQSTIDVDSCSAKADLAENKKLHREGEPVMGLLYGPHGVRCLPYYSAYVPDSRGYVN
jgi:hypothetical protein